MLNDWEGKMESYQNLKSRIHGELLEQIDFSREISDDELQELISEKLRRKDVVGYLDLHERIRMGKELFYMMRRLDIL